MIEVTSTLVTKRISKLVEGQVYDTSIQTVTGEDPYTVGSKNETSEFNYVEGSVLKVARNFVVDGGDSRNILSEFNGPVQFSQKVTNTSEEGFEANSLFLQGNATVSRQITVGIAKPTNAGNPGDIVYNANPTNGGYVGNGFIQPVMSGRHLVLSTPDK